MPEDRISGGTCSARKRRTSPPSKTGQRTPSPPDSALLPNYASRAPTSSQEKTVLDQSDEQGRKALTALSKKLAGMTLTRQSMLAYVMCSPLVTSTFCASASGAFADNKAITTQRFKNQVYTFSNSVTARNMNGDDAPAFRLCSVQNGRRR